MPHGPKGRLSMQEGKDHKSESFVKGAKTLHRGGGIGLEK